MTGGDKVFLFIISFVTGYLLLPTRADAYLDPGTGSFIFQAILGSLVVISVTVKLFWNRILGLFGVNRQASQNAESSREALNKADDPN
jgi:hypothetical protein